MTPKSSKFIRNILTLPATLATLILFAVLILYGIINEPDEIHELYPIFLGITGIIYSLVLFFIIQPYPLRFSRWKWLIAIANGIVLSLCEIVLPSELDIITSALIILTTTVSVIELDRWPTYIFMAIIFVTHLSMLDFHADMLAFIIYFGPYLLAVVLLEIVARLQTTNRRHVMRLESINDFVRRIISSIETTEVINLIHSAVQQSVKADTYYVAFLRGDRFELSLFYDEGEYFNNQNFPVEGSLCGWILKNKQSLLIHDLPRANFSFMVIGQEKVSLSWMGTPLYNGSGIIGVIAVASYRKNAFDQLDLELLESISQQASMALDNAKHHAEVEAQTHLDSLTGVCTHGYFLELLQQEADQAVQDKLPLSLIMLDIDYFKQYNDNYGHLVGDQVLVKLIDAIRGHIKNTDYIGRWGGEEFAILLPNANGFQATQVAERISQTLGRLGVIDRDGRKITLPTISQGIAMFPDEADEIFMLIDIADQRLYVAKERGRNQIEPNISHWKKLKI